MKKTLQNVLNAMLDSDYTDEDGNIISGADLLALRLFKRAIKGDVKAFQVIRDTCGQAPPINVVSANIDPEVINEVEEMVYNVQKEYEDEE